MSKRELGDGEPSPSPPDNNSETLARWIWANFVGIPVTEPYDKEYIALHDRIEKLQREWFVKGLTEARKQLGRSGAAQEVSPPSPEPKKPGTWPDKCLQRAFVDGASWWEWHKEKATMWQSDRKLAEAEAVRMYGKPTELGDTRELKAAANKLIDYCIAHDWGMMPEPYDSINPLLKLLGRFTERSGG